MKISKALLAKYAQGKCNPQEQQLVEDWLNQHETLEDKDEVGEFKKFHDETWRKIAHGSGFGKRKAITSARSLIRYAAAACIIFGAFIGGRVSANPGSAVTVDANGYKENLYLTGGPNLRTNLKGDHFRVNFKGTLSLYNASNKEQIITTGDSTFILGPKKVYYLSGSTVDPMLIEGFGNNYDDPMVSELSILRIDNE
ncbi:MAG: hypothetical protein AAGH81_16270 [Bacteroidota bacterium]